MEIIKKEKLEEFKLFFKIYNYEVLLLNYKQGVSCGAIKKNNNYYTSIEKHLKEASIKLMKYYGLEYQIYRSLTTYYIWYNFWNDFMESLTNDEWDDFYSLFEINNEKAEKFMPNNYWA